MAGDDRLVETPELFAGAFMWWRCIRRFLPLGGKEWQM